jgi:hypothetical protein
MVAFDSLGFDPAWSVEFEPEFLGDGDWRCPVFGFNLDGRLVEPFESRWGTPIVVSVEPSVGDRWVGMFAAGSMRGLRGVFACPDPRDLGVVCEGAAYLVDAFAPTAGARVLHGPVGQVTRVSGLDLVLLVGFVEVTAIGPNGIAWRTPRLAIDDLHVVRADQQAIVCTCDNLEGTETLELDPITGKQTAGRRLDAYWPPDALA